MIEVIARNLGGLELTRTAGALADEWEPGIGHTTMIERDKRLNPPSDDDESAGIPPPKPSRLPD
jgi:hypothetical protein